MKFYYSVYTTRKNILIGMVVLLFICAKGPALLGDAIGLSSAALFLYLGFLFGGGHLLAGPHCYIIPFIKAIEIHANNDAGGNSEKYIEIVRTRIAKCLGNGYTARIVAHNDIEVSLLYCLPDKKTGLASKCISKSHASGTTHYKFKDQPFWSRGKLKKKRINNFYPVYYFIIPPTEANIAYFENVDVKEMVGRVIANRRPKTRRSI